MAQGRYENPRRRKKKNNNYLLPALAALLLVISILVVGGTLFHNAPGDPSAGSPSNDTTVSDPTHTDPPGPTEPYIISSASIGVTGDLLMHLPVIDAAAIGNGKYDFSENFKYMKKYYESFDFMVANLETTLAGTARPYHGYPNFNCPDDLIDGLLGAGVDMLLTANNHTYDTGYDGMMRTQSVLKEKGMEHLGTRESESDPFYLVKDLNGIKVGMICYTYETGDTANGNKTLNGITLSKKAGPLVCSFDYNKIDKFYEEVKETLAAMKAAGADATMIYIHWGDEYQLTPNKTQKNIAKELCELGVDVIVGGHPHVVQPFETLTSSTGHETHCIYSVGNAISNQNRNTLSSKPVNVEDGMVFGVEFEKWSDGTVKISDISILPTWVNNEWRVNIGYVYNIIPLDTAIEVWDCYNVTLTNRTYESYIRTMRIVGNGLNQTREALGQPKVPLTFGE